MADWASGPGQHLRAVTTHDTNELATVGGRTCRALWVGGAGNLVVIARGDTSTVTLSGVPAGSLIPIAAKVVHTSTTATLIVAIY